MQPARDLLGRIASADILDSRITRVAVAVLGCLLCLIGAIAIVNAWVSDPPYPDHGLVDLNLTSDFDLYMRAAGALNDNPYRPELGSEFDRYGYPPLLAGLLAGLKMLLGPQLLGVLWPTFCVGCLVGAIVVLARGFGVKTSWRWIVLFVGIALVGRVVRWDIIHGQVNVIVLLLFAVGLMLRSQERVIAASVAFAVMMSLKPFMGAVVIYFALRGDWRMLRWGLGMGAAVFFASFLLTAPKIAEAFNGWREATHYFTSPPFVTKPDNQSAYALFLRLFTETPFSQPWINAPGLVPVFMTFAITDAIAVMVTGLHIGRQKAEAWDWEPKPGLWASPGVLLLECSMVVGLAMFCGPLTEGNHMIIAFAGLAGALLVGWPHIASNARHAGLWLAVIAAWALPVFFVVYPKMAAFTLGSPAFWTGLEGMEILLSGRCAITLFLACTLTAAALWQDRKSAVPAPEPGRASFGKLKRAA